LKTSTFFFVEFPGLFLKYKTKTQTFNWNITRRHVYQKVQVDIMYHAYACTVHRHIHQQNHCKTYMYTIEVKNSYSWNFQQYL